MTSTFQGMYVEDIKRALTASALSGVHCLLIGGAGLGKTTIEKAMARKMYPGKNVFLRFDSTTPPTKIQGTPDIGKLLSEQSEYVMITKGTAYDQNARLLIADELGRAMDTTFDIMLDVLDPQNDDVPINDRAVVWSTSNFMPTSDRTEAFRDRIGMWVWLPRERIDVRATVSAQLRSKNTGLEITDHLPTFDEIMKVRSWEVGPNADKAIGDLLDTLASEAELGSVSNQVTGSKVETMRFDVNYRRLDQWGRILFSMSAWITGDPDFKEIPNEARLCLQWAYPLTDEKMAQQWKTICTAVSDPIEAAIDSMKQRAFDTLQSVIAAYPNDKRAASVAFGEAVADIQNQLRMLGDDPRIDDVIAEVLESYSMFVAGKDPFKPRPATDDPF